jgi:hypothetical protein
MLPKSILVPGAVGRIHQKVKSQSQHDAYRRHNFQKTGHPSRLTLVCGSLSTHPFIFAIWALRSMKRITKWET